MSTLVAIQRVFSRHRDPELTQDSNEKTAFMHNIIRKAAKLCAPDGTENPTLQRVQDTWEDLIEYKRSSLDEKENTSVEISQHIRNLTGPELEQFLGDHRTPFRAYVALRWMANNLDISLPISEMQVHRTRPADP